ncbi:BTAD domain-containing putative transcriptional regulator [Sphaerisporangium sp. B11E5]|uniref:BTAD domain-containing putative transcriptional regulator n=1 Tax=Sphaerisporangium sp. B11E5 TaxID=3153563 RepID=UPI00325D1A72
MGRERVTRLLDAAVSRRLTTVVAGPGWGKTTALASWAARRDACWLSLGPGDDDPGHLTRRILAALRRAGASPGPPDPGDDAEAALRALLGSRPGPDAVLVLDDLQDLRTGGPAAALVERLVHTAPPGLRLVLASRTDLPFPVHRLDGQGHLSRVDATALRFRVDEVAALLSGAPTADPGNLSPVTARGPSNPAGAIAKGPATLSGDAPRSPATLSGDPTRSPAALSGDPTRSPAALSGDPTRSPAALSGYRTGSPATMSGDPTMASGDPARELLEVTAGWPAAVRMAAEARAGRSRTPLSRDPVLEYMAAEVLAHEPARTRELLADMTVCGPVTAALCRAIGWDDAGDLLPALARRGLAEAAGDGTSWVVARPLRDALTASLPRTPERKRHLHRQVAARHDRDGAYGAAARHLLAAGDHDALARLLAEHGARMAGDGEAASVAAAAEAVARVPDPRVHQAVGHALLVTGDWPGALASFRRAAGDDDVLDPGLAWRMGQLWHLRGDLDEAIRVYGRGVPGSGAPPDETTADETTADEVTADEAALLCWRAGARWAKGEFEGARDDAECGMAAAERCGDPGALATAHTTMALISAARGDRRANAWHYASALAYAGRAGGFLELLRIHVNRSSHFLEEGFPVKALDEAGRAVALAERCGHAYHHALALTNRGYAAGMLARHREAAADFTKALDLFQRLGSSMAAHALVGLGGVHLESGDTTRARAVYEEALQAAERSGDLQGTSGALIGLARVRAADDLPAARSLATRAVDLGHGLHHVQALVTRGWVTLLMDDREGAAADARRAGDLARSRRDRLGLAEALELTVLSDESPSSRLPLLREAAAIFAEAPHPAGAARVEVLTRWLTDGTRGPLPRPGGAASSLAVVARAEGPAIEIHALGPLRVLRDGTPVPAAEWKSKKARDLLKILVAKRGRAVSRDQLMDLLWPGEDDVAANRLSVLLYTLRRVLDPAGGAADGPLVTTRATARLDPRRAVIDVERFLTAADAGLRAYQRGEATAVRLLTAAESLYGGEFLEEDLYEDWTAGLREECAAAYESVTRALLDLAARAEDVDRVVSRSLRLLGRDPYDEGVHLGLVRALLDAGRYGEARRRYRLYRQAMHDIGVEPAPWCRPALAGPVAG